MIRFKQFLTQEERSNQNLNPKISINQRLKDYYKQAPSGEHFGLKKNAFVSFTHIEKLGINPQTVYVNSPLAICAYSLDYTIKTMGSSKSADYLPFGGNAPFANCFSAKGNILCINEMTEDQFKLYWNKVTNYCISKNVKNLPYEGNTTARKFWEMTRYAAKVTSSNIYNYVYSWNTIFRAIGIDGIHDKGKGILQETERSQAMFFHINSIENVKRYDNKWSPADKKEGEISKRMALDIIRNTREKERLTPIMNNAIEQGDDDTLFEILKDESNYRFFELLTHPSEKLALRLVAHEVTNMNYFKNMPIQTIKKFIDLHPDRALAYIERPSAEIEAYVIRKNPKIVADSIKYMRYWHPESIALAKKLDPSLDVEKVKVR